MMKIDKLHALELSLTVGCRLDCLYCPQKLLLGKYYGENPNRKSKLSFEDFKIALDKVQPGASISFCGMSEPFHNERCADMIVYAYEKGYKISLLTTLVGMTSEDFEKIKNIKFDSFVLHIPDAEKHSKFVIDDTYLDLLKKVNDTINVDYYSCHGSVHEVVKDIIDEKKYAGISLGDRAGNLEVKQITPSYKEGKIACYHGSEAQIGGWTPVMFPDGSLVLCCMDYGMKHVLGNLLTQSWPEIQEGEEYQKFAKGLKDDSIDILCRKCGDARKVENLPAIQFKSAVSNYEESLEKFPENVRLVIERFAGADTVCVFGLGKLFRDHFFQEYWHEGLGVSVLSDNNPAMQGTVIEGIPCIAPSELKEYSNVLVVVFVKNGESIISQLNSLGIENCISIDKLYDVCNWITGNAFRKMTKLQ
jgi:hypothetical protein